MTKDELRQYARVMVEDITIPYLCSDESMDGFIDEANKEAFERSLYGRLDSSYDLPIVAGTSEYLRDDLVFTLTRVKISGEDDVLACTTKREMDFQISGWEDAEQSAPKYYIQEDSKITLYPTPDSTGTLQLDGYRYPGSDMETPESQHESLAYWVMYRYYSIQDSDTGDIQKAEMNRDKFKGVFGHKKQQDHIHAWNENSTVSVMNTSPF